LSDRRESADQLDEEGARWAARMDRGLTKVEQAALDRWLEGDTRRLGALARARAAWFHAERASAIGGMPTSQTAIIAPNRRMALLGGGALAATVVAGVMGLSWRRPSSGSEASGIGEVRRVTLADGTVVTLDAASHLTTAIDHVQRVVSLLTGQAFFEVAHDPVRPFFVRAGAAVIRAIDSDFVVKLRPDATCAVLVRAGVVALTDGLAPLAAGRLLGAGWEATVATKGDQTVPQVTRLAPQSFDRLLAWREGQLSFAGDTLAEAAAEFERYNSAKIVVPDASLAAEPITGLFASNDPLGFARAIAVSLGARVTMRGDDIVIARVARGTT